MEGGGAISEQVGRRPDERGEWLFVPGSAQASPAVRAYIPRDKSPNFANDPAIEWRGSLNADTVRIMIEIWLTTFSDSECECKIWADEPAPEPRVRVFKRRTASEIAGYVRDWSSRANVSLSIRQPDDSHPQLYVWGALREAGVETTDKVGIKLDRRFFDGGDGVGIVTGLFEHANKPSVPIAMQDFLHNVEQRV